MFETRVRAQTKAAPEAVLATLKETSPERRHRFWSNVSEKRFRVHESGPGFLEVTEANFVAGLFWERCRYEWTGDRIRGTVLDSNVLVPGSWFEVRAARVANGPTAVEMSLHREFRRGPKGRVAALLNHLGGPGLFRWYLRTVLRAVEEEAGEGTTGNAPAAARERSS